MKLNLNVTTEDGELLEQIEVEVFDDTVYPIGHGMARAALLAEIESAALVVIHRAREVVQ